MDLSRKITRTVVPEELTVRRKVQHLARSNFTYRHYAAWTSADPRVFWHQSQNRQRDIRLDKLNDSESSTHRASQKAQPEDGPFNMDNWISKGRHPRNGNHISYPEGQSGVGSKLSCFFTHSEDPVVRLIEQRKQPTKKMKHKFLFIQNNIDNATETLL
ncbi:hypothetical protein GCK72_013188 [Caenorhabditis remanei]|uniref:Uncharacterized protein n=1 Tax=Caenorhabditis remanei TaxID=31234 RepID=A0A6A5GQ31_CAERE|nr:hypothetical protein GCK72_013188 [Caenorhabditis remanei]KAF1756734.1 hypothetical protein GCK72_013188 [Caenorhabditis remanei]